MLYTTQLKREFTSKIWQAGRTFFTKGSVSNLNLDGERVLGTVASDQGKAQVVITTSRGTISASTCTLHPGVSPHCEHVAALCIWVVEKGSILRAQHARTRGPIAEEEQPRLKSVTGTPIAFVRGIFQNKVLSAISVEPAVKYTDPDTEETEVTLLHRLVKQKGEAVWKTTGEVFIKLYKTEVPILGQIDAATVFYKGSTGIERLVDLMTQEEFQEERDQIVFHPDLKVSIEPVPLKLIAVRVGANKNGNRILHYTFGSSESKVTSKDLAELATLSRLSDHFFWKGNRIYRIDPSLSTLAQFTNRSGVASSEAGEDKLPLDGYGYLLDNDKNPLHPLAVYRLGLELGVENLTVDPEWTQFHEWKAQFEKKKIPNLTQLGYGFDLREYQTNGLEWLWSLYHRGLSALLADDMGLGKTHQVLAFLTTIYSKKTRNTAVKPTLVVAPTSVLAAWIQKLQRYPTGLKWHVFHGGERKFPTKRVDIILTSYGILQREPILREHEWHVVVLDEAQSIKNATTVSSRIARAMNSQFRIAMTGTPVENAPSDLWPVMDFLLPGYLGSLPRFKRLYGSGRETPTQSQADSLKRLVTPFLLRRTKTQVLKELPEKTIETVSCEITTEQRKAYRQALLSAEAEKARENLQNGEKINYANILALLTRLKQISDHPRLPELTAGTVKLKNVDPYQSGKWETVDELIHEALRSELKVVVFTQYLGMMDMLGYFLKERSIGYAELRGDTRDRAAELEKFASDPECKVFVCSLLAGGLGIDLTSASVCIHLDRWWNPAKENQATDRLHRIGQTRGVQVFKLQIPGTVEDRIAEIIDSKTQLSEALVEESSVALKAFSRKELLDLLTFDENAVPAVAQVEEKRD